MGVGQCPLPHRGSAPGICKLCEIKGTNNPRETVILTIVTGAQWDPSQSTMTDTPISKLIEGTNKSVRGG